MKFLAIIPARFESKGVKHKNIRIISGKPLIQYTFESTRNIKHITKTIVSSDSKKILFYGRKYKHLTLIKRPKYLARDKSLMIDVIKYHINLEKKLKNNYDYIVILSPTSPMRTKKQIKEALELVKKQKPDSLISVVKLMKPLNWLLSINNKGKLREYMGSGSAFGNRQNQKQYFFPNGAIYIIKIKNIFKNKYYFNNSIPYIMDSESSLDIDSIEDIQYFKTLKKLNRN